MRLYLLKKYNRIFSWCRLPYLYGCASKQEFADFTVTLSHFL